jgi:ribosomal protein S18 acetylase RimI-like enzyme
MNAQLSSTFDLSRLSFRSNVRHSDLIAVGKTVRSSGYFSEVEIETAVELVEEALLDGQFSPYLFLFAEFEQALVGYCCFGQIPLTDSSYDVYWIAVNEEWRSRGVGSEIMRRTEEEIVRLGGSRIYVDTSGRAQYGPTRKFYQARGYLLEAVLKDFYAAGDDKLIYCRTIKPPSEPADSG